eukprot:3907158-Pyramimonas_sp.AAC.1
MTPRYVYKLMFVKNEKSEMERAIRLRLVLRGFMDLEAFDVETFSGAARQRARSNGSLRFPRNQHGLPERVGLPGTCRGNW